MILHFKQVYTNDLSHMSLRGWVLTNGHNLLTYSNTLKSKIYGILTLARGRQISAALNSVRIMYTSNPSNYSYNQI